MKAQHAVWKKQSFERLLLGLFVVMMLAATQACSDPLSAHEATHESETDTSLNNADGGDKAAGINDGPSSDEGDQDDPNAPYVGGEDEGGAHDGPPDGDYPDLGRPGQVVICHVSADDTAAPLSLSLLPGAVADHTVHPDDYDGPCNEEDKENDGGTDDQGSDDQDDPNAQPVGGGNDDGNNTSNQNDGRGSAGS